MTPPCLKKNTEGIVGKNDVIVGRIEVINGF